jgi:hypothetical protein
LQPPLQRAELIDEGCREGLFLHQGCGCVKLLRSQQVVNRLAPHLLLGIPTANATMILMFLRRLGLFKAALQHLSKKMVIAILLARIIQRDQKEIVTFQTG